MPELPEVETIARSLDKLVRGRTIRTARLIRARLAPDITPARFAARLRNRRINFVHRRGKHILFDLSGGVTLIVHLRMSGRFSLVSAESTEPKFTHAVFHLDQANKLVFDDQRHFGLMKIVPTPKLAEVEELKKLAPEPFSEEFSAAYLYGVMRSSKKSLKELLIDQTKVCGVGNIYASEAMFEAGIHPALPANRVSKPRVVRLHGAIRAVLEEAISFAAGLKIDPEDLEGNYFSSGGDAWAVYDREEMPCRRCGSPVIRLKQAGRSTYFCRTCQRR